MISAIWRRWIERGQWWWLALLGVVLLADIIIGSWLIAWELKLFKELWSNP